MSVYHLDSVDKQALHNALTQLGATSASIQHIRHKMHKVKSSIGDYDDNDASDYLRMYVDLGVVCYELQQAIHIIGTMEGEYNV